MKFTAEAFAAFLARYPIWKNLGETQTEALSQDTEGEKQRVLSAMEQCAETIDQFNALLDNNTLTTTLLTHAEIKQASREFPVLSTKARYRVLAEFFSDTENIRQTPERDDIATYFWLKDFNNTPPNKSANYEAWALTGLGEYFFEQPTRFAAFILWLIQEKVSSSEILSSDILHAYLLHHYPSGEESDQVERVYAILQVIHNRKASVELGTLLEKAHKTIWRDGNDFNYALTSKRAPKLKEGTYVNRRYNLNIARLPRELDLISDIYPLIGVQAWHLLNLAIQQHTDQLTQWLLDSPERCLSGFHEEIEDTEVFTGEQINSILEIIASTLLNDFGRTQKTVAELRAEIPSISRYLQLILTNPQLIETGYFSEAEMVCAVETEITTFKRRIPKSADHTQKIHEIINTLKSRFPNSANRLEIAVNAIFSNFLQNQQFHLRKPGETNYAYSAEANSLDTQAYETQVTILEQQLTFNTKSALNLMQQHIAEALSAARNDMNASLKHAKMKTLVQHLAFQKNSGIKALILQDRRYIKLIWINPELIKDFNHRWIQPECQAWLDSLAPHYPVIKMDPLIRVLTARIKHNVGKLTAEEMLSTLIDKTILNPDFDPTNESIYVAFLEHCIDKLEEKFTNACIDTTLTQLTDEDIFVRLCHLLNAKSPDGHTYNHQIEYGKFSFMLGNWKTNISLTADDVAVLKLGINALKQSYHYAVASHILKVLSRLSMDTLKDLRLEAIQDNLVELIITNTFSEDDTRLKSDIQKVPLFRNRIIKYFENSKLQLLDKIRYANNINQYEEIEAAWDRLRGQHHIFSEQGYIDHKFLDKRQMQFRIIEGLYKRNPSKFEILDTVTAMVSQYSDDAKTSEIKRILLESLTYAEFPGLQGRIIHLLEKPAEFGATELDRYWWLMAKPDSLQSLGYSIFERDNWILFTELFRNHRPKLSPEVFRCHNRFKKFLCIWMIKSLWKNAIDDFTIDEIIKMSGLTGSNEEDSFQKKAFVCQELLNDDRCDQTRAEKLLDYLLETYHAADSIDRPINLLAQPFTTDSKAPYNNKVMTYVCNSVNNLYQELEENVKSTDDFDKYQTKFYQLKQKFRSLSNILSQYSEIFDEKIFYQNYVLALHKNTTLCLHIDEIIQSFFKTVEERGIVEPYKTRFKLAALRVFDESADHLTVDEIYRGLRRHITQACLLNSNETEVLLSLLSGLDGPDKAWLLDSKSGNQDLFTTLWISGDFELLTCLLGVENSENEFTIAEWKSAVIAHTVMQKSFDLKNDVNISRYKVMLEDPDTRMELIKQTNEYTQTASSADDNRLSSTELYMRMARIAFHQRRLTDTNRDTTVAFNDQSLYRYVLKPKQLIEEQNVEDAYTLLSIAISVSKSANYYTYGECTYEILEACLTLFESINHNPAESVIDDTRRRAYDTASPFLDLLIEKPGMLTALKINGKKFNYPAIKPLLTSFIEAQLSSFANIAASVKTLDSLKECIGKFTALTQFTHIIALDSLIEPNIPTENRLTQHLLSIFNNDFEFDLKEAFDCIVKGPIKLQSITDGASAFYLSILHIINPSRIDSFLEKLAQELPTTNWAAYIKHSDAALIYLNPTYNHTYKVFDRFFDTLTFDAQKQILNHLAKEHDTAETWSRLVALSEGIDEHKISEFLPHFISAYLHYHEQPNYLYHTVSGSKIANYISYASDDIKIRHHALFILIKKTISSDASRQRIWEELLKKINKPVITRILCCIIKALLLRDTCLSGIENSLPNFLDSVISSRQSEAVTSILNCIAQEKVLDENLFLALYRFSIPTFSNNSEALDQISESVVYLIKKGHMNTVRRLLKDKQINTLSHHHIISWFVAHTENADYVAALRIIFLAKKPKTLVKQLLSAPTALDAFNQCLRNLTPKAINPNEYQTLLVYLASSQHNIEAIDAMLNRLEAIYSDSCIYRKIALYAILDMLSDRKTATFKHIYVDNINWVYAKTLIDFVTKGFKYSKYDLFKEAIHLENIEMVIFTYNLLNEFEYTFLPKDGFDIRLIQALIRFNTNKQRLSDALTLAVLSHKEIFCIYCDKISEPPEYNQLDCSTQSIEAYYRSQPHYEFILDNLGSRHKAFIRAQRAREHRQVETLLPLFSIYKACSHWTRPITTTQDDVLTKVPNANAGLLSQVMYWANYFHQLRDHDIPLILIKYLHEDFPKSIGFIIQAIVRHNYHSSIKLQQYLFLHYRNQDDLEGLRQIYSVLREVNCILESSRIKNFLNEAESGLPVMGNGNQILMNGDYALKEYPVKICARDFTKDTEFRITYLNYHIIWKVIGSTAVELTNDSNILKQFCKKHLSAVLEKMASLRQDKKLTQQLRDQLILLIHEQVSTSIDARNTLLTFCRNSENNDIPLYFMAQDPEILLLLDPSILFKHIPINPQSTCESLDFEGCLLISAMIDTTRHTLNLLHIADKLEVALLNAINQGYINSKYSIEHLTQLCDPKMAPSRLQKNSLRDAIESGNTQTIRCFIQHHSHFGLSKIEIAKVLEDTGRPGPSNTYQADRVYSALSDVDLTNVLIYKALQCQSASYHYLKHVADALRNHELSAISHAVARYRRETSGFYAFFTTWRSQTSKTTATKLETALKEKKTMELSAMPRESVQSIKDCAKIIQESKTYRESRLVRIFKSYKIVTESGELDERYAKWLPY